VLGGGPIKNQRRKVSGGEKGGKGGGRPKGGEKLKGGHFPRHLGQLTKKRFLLAISKNGKGKRGEKWLWKRRKGDQHWETGKERISNNNRK